jgi:hypothetical protein
MTTRSFPLYDTVRFRAALADLDNRCPDEDEGEPGECPECGALLDDNGICSQQCSQQLTVDEEDK